MGRAGCVEEWDERGEEERTYLHIYIYIYVGGWVRAHRRGRDAAGKRKT